jgi:TetR/AcrR family transcriptional regulator, fatty acid metabolism regulator protein
MARPIDTQDSRVRLLAAGRALFASLGYEQTPTSAIAREARTSESQLVRHFSGKRALLTAIFNESWRVLNAKISEEVAAAPNALAAIKGVFATLLVAFERDRQVAQLFLFEGRRIHSGEKGLMLSDGYLEFVGCLQDLIRRAQKEGSITREIDAVALCSGLMGAAEGMIRDRVMAEHLGKPSRLSIRKIRQIFGAFLQGVRGQRPFSRPGRRKGSTSSGRTLG